MEVYLLENWQKLRNYSRLHLNKRCERIRVVRKSFFVYLRMCTFSPENARVALASAFRGSKHVVDKGEKNAWKCHIRKQRERNAEKRFARALQCDKSTMRASCFKERCTLSRLDGFASAYYATNCNARSSFRRNVYVGNSCTQLVYSVTRYARLANIHALDMDGYSCTRRCVQSTNGNIAESRVVQSRRRCQS